MCQECAWKSFLPTIVIMRSLGVYSWADHVLDAIEESIREREHITPMMVQQIQEISDAGHQPW